MRSVAPASVVSVAACTFGALSARIPEPGMTGSNPSDAMTYQAASVPRSSFPTPPPGVSGKRLRLAARTSFVFHGWPT
ncbi:Uncharacterised protein [Mycobacteroides abscessus]|nr:Uncharacterised protein [Mycobacteroides abscessus]